MLNKSRLLGGAFFSLTLVIVLVLPTIAGQDIISIYSDAAYTLPETTFGDGDTVYVEVTDNTRTATDTPTEGILESIKGWLTFGAFAGMIAIFVFYMNTLRNAHRLIAKQKDERIAFLEDQIKLKSPPSFIERQMQVIKRLAEGEVERFAAANLKLGKEIEKLRSSTSKEKKQLELDKKALEAEISELRLLITGPQVVAKKRSIQRQTTELPLLENGPKNLFGAIGEEDQSVVAVVLAAGEGTRMRSTLSKLLRLHPISSQALVRFAVNACVESGIKKTIVVVGYQAEEIKSTLGEGFEYVYQEKRLGTGHALKQAVPLLKDFRGELIVLPGNAPFITSSLLTQIIEYHRETRPAATVLTAYLDDPNHYGRIIRGGYENGHRQIQRIVESKDATSDELKIKEINSGIYCFDTQQVLPLLPSLNNSNKGGKYYLSDVIELLSKRRLKVVAVRALDPVVALTVTNPEELKRAWRILGKRWS